jgi:methylthioribose-1-phosphate isomerase
MAALVAIKYERPGDGAASLRLLDQRLLPHTTEWLDVTSVKDAWNHIKDMVVRGAPVRRGRANWTGVWRLAIFFAMASLCCVPDLSSIAVVLISI